jgi:hypothetical protein
VVDLKDKFVSLSRIGLTAARAKVEEIRWLPAHADITELRDSAA